ncbi:MAG: hypothetical protein R3B57_13710 [Phycisphaerales bacterium]
MASIDGTLIPLVGIVFGCSIAIVAIIAGTVKASLRRKHVEESRREIAAYVAEGSMTPEDAERILAAGPKDRGCNI